MIYEQACHLAKSHGVEMLTWKSGATPYPARDWACVQHRALPVRGDMRFTRVARALFRGLASPELYYYPPLALPELPPADLGIYHYSFAYPWLLDGERREIRRVVMFHNLESDLFEERASATGNPLARWLHRRNSRVLRRHEAALSGLADELWFISPADLDSYRTRNPGARNLRLTPPIFPAELRQMRSRITQGRARQLVLGFAGALNFGPNQDSVRWIFRDLCPALARAGFTGELRIAGRGAPAWVAAEAAAFPFVKVLGFVADIEAFFADLSIVLSPCVSGSGVRLKLLEALASGVPALTHMAALPQLAPGLRVCPGMFVSDSAEEWAARIVREEPYAWRSAFGDGRTEEALRGEAVYEFLRLS